MMNKKLATALIALILGIPLLFTASISYTVTPGKFLVYNETVYIYNQNKTLVNEIVIIQQVLTVYNNGSYLVNSTVVSVTQNSTVSSTVGIQNPSEFGLLYRVDPEMLGKTIKDGNTSLEYNGTEDGLYKYVGRSALVLNGQEESTLILYFNSSGVVVKGVDCDVANGALLSKSIINLWTSNFFSNATLPKLNVGHIKPISVNLSSLYFNLGKKIEEGIIFIGLFSILIILLFRKHS
ncbi:MAG: hypothetical protein MPF33_00780 [Candidatus Aramenus sp.]|jgi:outer membrane protein assembly factor BamE (lipoprotein component of BamABCDE complex)|nr:hypothetical protein [Candidatus Aramenus sp.]